MAIGPEESDRFCTLSFQYDHLRRVESQKSASPFWVGKAKCRTGDCIQVTMSTQDEPLEVQDVAADVHVNWMSENFSYALE